MKPDASSLDSYRLRSAPVDRFLRLTAPPDLCVPLGGRSAPLAPSVPSSLQPATIPAPTSSHMESASGLAVAASSIPLPLFWYNPPWHLASPQRCQLVAQLVGEAGIAINALHRDLTGGEGDWNDAPWTRIATLRCDRLGWSLEDCQSAGVIELRLGMDRDPQGGYSYDPSLVANLIGVESDQLPGLLPPVPMMFPPEWNDLSHMGSKVTQLRRLSSAAVYITCDEQQISTVLSAATVASADGLIIRCGGSPINALAAYRQWINESPHATCPRVWIAGAELSVQDMVKCLALGASAVSISSICDRWLLGENGPELSLAERAALNLGVTMGQTPEQRLRGDVQRTIGQLTTAIKAQMQGLFVRSIDELSLEHLVPVTAKSV